MDKKLPGELRKEKARVEKSRDIFKERNKEKAAKIKRLIDDKEDVEKSREEWRRRYRETKKEQEQLEQTLQSTQQALLDEQQLSSRLQAEIEAIKKKPQI
jgi:chromosome segregation ATPase